MNLSNRPVVGLDIDGTLGDFYPHFLRFAAAWLGKPVDEHGYNLSQPVYRYLGVSKTTYRQVKKAYRMGGMKRSMPVFPGAPEFVRAVRKRAQVYICTTRPYLSHDNIDDDTRHWLRRSGMYADGVIWGEHKYRELRRTVGDRLVATLDDLPDLVFQADQVGAYSITIKRPHNAGNIGCGPRAANYEEALDLIDGALEGWRDRNERSGNGGRAQRGQVAPLGR
jgi:hypothetical protein